MNVTLAYCVCSSELDYLWLSLSVMYSYDWVDRIIVLITDHNSPPKHYGKLSVNYLDCGLGFHLSVEDGGYNELKAKQYLIEKLLPPDCDYVCLLDSDECLTYDTYTLIEMAEQFGYSGVFLECYVPDSDSEGQSFVMPERVCTVKGIKLLDPHIRIFKPTVYPNTLRSYPRNEQANKSRHVGVRDKSPTYDNTLVVNDKPYHLHFSDWLRPKGAKPYLGELKNDSITIPLPYMLAHTLRSKYGSHRPAPMRLPPDEADKAVLDVFNGNRCLSLSPADLIHHSGLHRHNANNSISRLVKQKTLTRTGYGAGTRYSLN